jgi:hypothetical protein
MKKIFLLLFPLFLYSANWSCPANTLRILTSSTFIPSMSPAGYPQPFDQTTCTGGFKYTPLSQAGFYSYEERSYTIVSSCPDDTFPDLNGVCKSPSCPEMMELSVSGDYCVPITCPIGTVKAPSTGFCIPKECPKGQTLISDGTCQTTCPPNSSRVGKICRKDCGSYSYQDCGKYLDSSGNTCSWSIFPDSFGSPMVFTSSEYGTVPGQCKTSTDAFQDHIHNFMPGTALPLKNIPKIPAYEPQPVNPYKPANNPEYVPVPKPANNPDYVPPVVPKPVEPIPLTPVPAYPVNPNDPNFVPTPSVPLPLTPNIAPYSPPAPAPAPAPLPAPETVPLPTPEFSPIISPMPTPELEMGPASGSTQPKTTPDYIPPPVTPIEPNPDGTPSNSGYPAPIEYPSTSMPDVPDLDYFTLDNLDKFRYDAQIMSENILNQVANTQNTFTNTFDLLNNGFQPISIPAGSCGGGMVISAFGKTTDLCPPLAESVSQFAPLFQLLTFLVGLIISIRIFLSGLRD